MLFTLMKIVTWLLSPLGVALLGVAAGAALVRREKTRVGWAVILCAWLWLWVWSSPWCFALVGGALERQYPSVNVATLPRADAIVVLGGGMGSATKLTVYPELYPGADRGWQAARCFHAGKAPVIIFSGVGEGPGMRRFLMDLGVPAAKIVLETESKNTYENSLFTRKKLEEIKAKRVILVTSAWHMRRSVMTFKKMGVEVIPSGCDYEALSMKAWLKPTMILYYLPTPDALAKNSAAVKEHIGYWAYWLYLRMKGEAAPTPPPAKKR